MFIIAYCIWLIHCKNSRRSQTQNYKGISSTLTSEQFYIITDFWIHAMHVINHANRSSLRQKNLQFVQEDKALQRCLPDIFSDVKVRVVHFQQVWGDASFHRHVAAQVINITSFWGHCALWALIKCLSLTSSNMTLTKHPALPKAAVPSILEVQWILVQHVAICKWAGLGEGVEPRNWWPASQ